jgi:signal transduction histidine kinase
MQTPKDTDSSYEEAQYYKRQLNELAGTVINVEYRLAEMSNEINQMRRGFDLIANVQHNTKFQDTEKTFDYFTEELVRHMQMDRGLVLMPSEHVADHFAACFPKGYSQLEVQQLQREAISIPQAFIIEKTPLLHNSETAETQLSLLLCTKLKTRYFILLPVIVRSKTIAFLFMGRKAESLSMASSRLLIHDVHTFEAITGMIAAIINQIDQFKLVENERTRISLEMHDEIGSELTKVKMFSQLLLRNASDNNAELIRNISDTTSKVLENIGEIIWTMSSWNDNLPNLTAYLRRYATGYFEVHRLNCQIEVSDGLPEVVVSGHYRRNIFLFFKEALHNIVKHASASSATVRIDFRDNQLHVIIQDNGRGLTEGNIPGNGMYSMKHRIA